MVQLIVIHPDNENKYKNRFLHHLQNKDLTAHMVFMPGCGHCDDMKPSWKSACNDLSNLDYKMITLIHMDSYNNFMKNKDSPSGFPHVVIHKNSKIIPYSGDRSKSDILNWLNKNKETVKNGGGKTRKKPVKKNKFTRKKDCKNFTIKKHKKVLHLTHVLNRVSKKNKNYFIKNYHLNNINKWSHDSKIKYKNLIQKYIIKPNTNKWNSLKNSKLCSITNTIKKNSNIPIIGILSNPIHYDEHSGIGVTSYIPQSYVKWAELHGARVLPIQYDLPFPMIDSLLEQINGILLIGGNIETKVNHNKSLRYLATVQHIFQKTIHFNMSGNYFPLFTICLGFEILPMLVNKVSLNDIKKSLKNPKNKNISKEHFIDKSSIKFTELSEKDNKQLLCKSIGQYFTKNEIKEIEQTPVTYFTHGKAFILNKKYVDEYKKFLQIIATANRNSNKEIIAMYQFISFPIYGTQFHPEKARYERREKNLTHSESAIMFSNKLSKIFTEECKKNPNISSFVGNINNNLLIENYDLLSRQNNNKILYPLENKIHNDNMFNSVYYFGKIDKIDTKL